MNTELTNLVKNFQAQKIYQYDDINKALHTLTKNLNQHELREIGFKNYFIDNEMLFNLYKSFVLDKNNHPVSLETFIARYTPYHYTKPMTETDLGKYATKQLAALRKFFLKLLLKHKELVSVAEFKVNLAKYTGTEKEVNPFGFNIFSKSLSLKPKYNLNLDVNRLQDFYCVDENGIVSSTLDLHTLNSRFSKLMQSFIKWSQKQKSALTI